MALTREKGRLKRAGTVLIAGAIALGVIAPLKALAESTLTSITFQLSNDSFKLETDAPTLGDLFRELGLELSPEYLGKLGHSLSSSPPKKISLPGVSIHRLTEEEQIPAKVLYKVFPTQGEARVEVRSPGKNGVRRLSIAVFTLDGKTVGGRTTSQVIRPPKQKVVAIFRPVDGEFIPDYETILRMRRLASREFNPPARAKKVLTMEATAYSPEEATAGWGDPQSTAIGLKAGYGVVAVDPDVIPLRTRLYIEGYGYAVAGDVGGAIKGNRIDLGFDTEKEAVNFGRRDVKVWVLD